VLDRLGYRPDTATIEASLAGREHGCSLRRADGAAVDLHWSLGDGLPPAADERVWCDVAPAPRPGDLGPLRLSPS